MREATQSAILQAAMRLFAEEGYARSSVRDIAKDAGISPGLLYHYFPGKEALLRALFLDCMMRLSSRFTTVLSAAPPGRELLEALLALIFRQLREEREFWNLFYSLRVQPPVLRLLGDEIRSWTERLRGIFTESFTAMHSRDPELEAYLLYSYVEGTIQQFLLSPESYPLEPVAERILSSIRRKS